MNITSAFYKYIILYLNDELSLQDLEDWFIKNFGEILSLPDCPAYDLAGELQLALAEMSIGNKTEDELKALMRDLIATNNTVICTSELYSITTSTSSPAPSIFALENDPSPEAIYSYTLL